MEVKAYTAGIFFFAIKLPLLVGEVCLRRQCFAVL